MLGARPPDSKLSEEEYTHTYKNITHTHVHIHMFESKDRIILGPTRNSTQDLGFWRVEVASLWV